MALEYYFLWLRMPLLKDSKKRGSPLKSWNRRIPCAIWSGARELNNLEKKRAAKIGGGSDWNSK